MPSTTSLSPARIRSARPADNRRAVDDRFPGRALNTTYRALGWPQALRRARHAAADDVYVALVSIEKERGISEGGPLRVSYHQIADRAKRDHSKIGHHLDYLYEVGLLSEFTRGSGSGPKARDRSGSLVVRAVPIPAPCGGCWGRHRPRDSKAGR